MTTDIPSQITEYLQGKRKSFESLDIPEGTEFKKEGQINCSRAELLLISSSHERSAKYSQKLY